MSWYTSGRGLRGADESVLKYERSTNQELAELYKVFVFFFFFYNIFVLKRLIRVKVELFFVSRHTFNKIILIMYTLTLVIYNLCPKPQNALNLELNFSSFQHSICYGGQYR